MKPTNATAPQGAVTKYAIESGIPVPAGRRTYGDIFPFAAMTQAGQSFMHPCKPTDAKRWTTRIWYHAKRFGEHNKRRFRVRPVDGGVRCWRVE